MNERNARFYFANLTADVARCISAGTRADDVAYEQSLIRARKTLEYIRVTGNREAYEDGRLLLRALFFARQDDALDSFADHVNELGVRYSPLIA